MKKVVKFLGLFLCMGTFTLFALGSGSSGDKNNSEKVGEVETKQDEKKDSSSENGESKTEETEETTKDSELSEYHVGDVLTYKGLSITYVSSSDYVSDNDFMQPADGNKYIRLELYAENNSGSDKSVTSFEFKCYADGYECESKYFDDDISLSLSDGRTGTGAIYLFFARGNSLKLQRHFPKVAAGNSSKLHLPFPYPYGYRKVLLQTYFC